VPATTYVPASTPTVAGLTLITDHVFSQKYGLIPPPSGGSDFPFGAKIAIPVVWAALMALGVFVWLYIRKLKARKRAEAARATTFPAEEPVMPQMTMSRTPTAHELDSTDPPPVSPSETPAGGWPIYQTSSPPAYDPANAAPAPAPAPVLTKQPPAAPQELPGSTYLHEHHPAYSSRGGSSVGTPTESVIGSPPRTFTPASAGAEDQSPALSAVTPRSDSHHGSSTIGYVSPLGSPRLPETK
jgi:hypothetical protein